MRQVIIAVIGLGIVIAMWSALFIALVEPFHIEPFQIESDY